MVTVVVLVVVVVMATAGSWSVAAVPLRSSPLLS